MRPGRCLKKHGQCASCVLNGLLNGVAASTNTGVERSGSAACDALVIVANRVARDVPLLIVLDNLDDADALTLRTIQQLATDSTEASHLMVLGLHRPGTVDPRLGELLTDPASESFELLCFDVDEVIEAVEMFTGGPLAPGVAESLLTESQGDPASVMRIARARAERFIERRVVDAVQRAELVRGDMRVVREELSTSLRELGELRLDPAWQTDGGVVDPEGTPPKEVPCPYQGLTAFQAEHSEWYYGREPLVAELAAKLASASFVGVVGASGSGKSSLVRAGLLPSLASGSLPDSASWLPVTISPGSEPMAALADGLSSIVSGVSLATMEERLRHEGLARTAAGVIEAHEQSTRLLLVIDQFEEIFTAATDEDTLLFMDTVASAVPQIAVVIALRADFYGQCGAHPALASMLQDSQLLVGPMTRAELYRAITAPARAAGLVIEPGLPDAIIFDASDEPGLLPLVSTALLETWKRRRGRSLTLAGYADAGGVQGAIAHLAEDVYASLDDDGCREIRRIFMRLASPGEDRGEFRRRVPLPEVADSDRASATLATLVDRRLVTVDGDSVEVAHEALFREWPRLRVWLTDDREGRRLHQQIAVASGEWQSSGRESALLLRGSRMAAALDFASSERAALNEIEFEFLEASRRQANAELIASRRTTRRLRGLLVGASIVLVAAIIVGAFAFIQRGRADKEANRSEARGLASQARDLASRSESVLDPYARLLLAIESEMTTPVPSTEARIAWADASAAMADQPALLERAPIPTTGGAVTSLSWNSSDSAIAVSNADGTVSLVSPDGASVRTLVTGEDTIGGSLLAWSPDGTRLAVALADSSIRMFDNVGSQTAPPLGTPVPVVPDRVTSMRWNPTGTVVAVSNQAGLTFVDADGQALSIKADVDCVQLGWNRAGSRLVGLCNRTLDLFDDHGRAASVPASLTTLGGETSAARWSPVNGSLAVYNTTAGVIVIGAGGETVWAHFDSAARFTDAFLDWSSDGELLAMQGYDAPVFATGLIRIFDGATGTVDAVHDRVTNVSKPVVAWNPTNHLIAVGASDGSVEIDQLDVATNSLVVSAETGATAPGQLLWDPSGTYLAAVGADSRLTLLAASGERLGRELTSEGGTTAVQWNGATSLFAIGDRNGNVRVLRPVPLRGLDETPVEFDGIPEWSPDSKYIAGMTNQGDVVLTDPALQPVTAIRNSALLYSSSRSWSTDSSSLAMFDINSDGGLQDAHIVSPNGNVRFSIANHSPTLRDQINYLEWAHHRNDLLVTTGHSLTVYDDAGAVVSGPIEIGQQVFPFDTSREYGTERHRVRDQWSSDDSMVAVLVQDPADATRQNVLVASAGAPSARTIDFGSFDPTAMAWSPTSDTLAVGGEDGSLRIVTSGGTKVSAPVAGGSRPIVVLEWLAGALLTKDAAGAVRLRAPDGSKLAEPADQSRCGDPVVSPTRTAFVLPCGPNTLHFYDADARLTGSYESSQDLSPPEWSPIGSVVNVIDTQGRLRLVTSDGIEVGEITPFSPGASFGLAYLFWAPNGAVIEGAYRNIDSILRAQPSPVSVYAWSEAEACQYLHKFLNAEALDTMLDLEGEHSRCGSSAAMTPLPLLPVMTRRPDGG